MKKYCLLIFLLLLAVHCLADEPYYNTREGVVLHYERYKAGSGKLEQTTRIGFDSVANTPDGQRVYYDMLLKKSNGRPLYGGSLSMTTDIDQNGDMMMNMDLPVIMALKNLFPRVKVRSESIPAILPSRIQPGDTIPPAHAVVFAGSLKVTIDVTERVVLRQETISTPAGTFDCIVISEHKVEKSPVHHDDRVSLNWYARGIGFVRHDSFDKDMRAISSEVLTRIESPLP